MEQWIDAVRHLLDDGEGLWLADGAGTAPAGHAVVGTSGKLLSVAVMIFGISLFLWLIQVVLRPSKAYFPCPTCGLRRHDHDAVHCKACGTVLSIPDDGLD